MSDGLGAFIAGCSGLALTPAEQAFFAETRPFGFILFARNVADPDQLRRLTRDLRQTVGRDAPILIDQEGGRVQRLRPPHWRSWAPAFDQIAAAGPEGAARSMYLRARLIACELSVLGIDVDCAPVADIARPETHEILKNRCYGTDPSLVIACARATAEGLLAGGVLPVIKHIPGHGRASADSHLHLPRVKTGAQELQATDFSVFRALSDQPMAMTAHVVYDALDPDRPATVSPAAIAAIRDEIGFGGFLMSDDVSMQALSGGIAERSRASIAAGCDAVLHCNGDMDEMAEVAGACGTLTGPAAERAARALACRRPPEPFDPAVALAELHGLLGTAAHG
ncbi:beta-N-acetylhexosaminidase [Rhodovulum sp. MB263]|uniref:beta-N-acetylhexosaminidase n=1 Tax=Rhodovulum sp. (strain MB263) TaxID=308754 RepID=UPI0009B78ABB|nr:beta-N-acetylhexosaminidase [Rhodovulum sp. MB263]ARC88994.1 beta-N-acetylhexosaminidase [Rhodovulum sp. MB263]